MRFHVYKNILILVFAISFLPAIGQSYFPPLVGDDWETVTPESLGWCPEKMDTLFNYLEARNSKAFIVLKDGKIVIEKYFGAFTKDDPWYWASAGKTITAFMVGIAQQEGHLVITDTTSKYLGTGWTSCTPAQEEKITIRHQLTMTSGLDDGVADHHCTDISCLNCIADAGTRWAYHNGPYTLLDSVIKEATNQSYNSYVNQKLKAPTGITGTFIKSGYDNVFYSKPRSMARFGLLILNRGEWDGNKIMTDETYFDQMINPSQTLNNSYGYLWWLNGKASYRMPTLQFEFPGFLSPNAPDDMIAALGKNGQFINVVPSQNLVFIRMGDTPVGGEVSMTFNDTIWQRLNDVMCVIDHVDAADASNRTLNIYPNPAQQEFSVNLPGQKFDLACFNLSGQIIYEEKNISNEAEIDSKGFTNGIYFIRIATDKQRVYYEKLIKTD